MLTTTATDLQRLMHCIGSRLMPASVPSANKQQRDEGNAAHWLAEQMFKGEPVLAGTTAPNGHVITDDMVEHVANYVTALGPGGSMESDTSYSGAGWEVRGRADHTTFHEGGSSNLSVLTVDDLKWGWRAVEPVENWTLLSHAIGWVIRNETRPDRIVLRIHQPRPHHALGPVRQWALGYEELMGYYTRISERLSNPTDELVTGVQQCAKCHARYDCRAFDAAVYNAIDVAGEVFDDTLPKDVLVREYALFQQAEQMLKIAREAREELITHKIKGGDVFPGWTVERPQGHRRFKPGLTGTALSIATGKNLVKDGIVTPAEAERRGVPKDVIAKLTERPLLEPKLRRVDIDARARAAFGEP